jgi:hypothetical protein
VDVVITSDSGAIIVEGNGFDYLATVVEGVSPPTGQEGTVVRLHGNIMLGGGTEIISATVAGQVAVVVQPYLDLYISLIIPAAVDSESGALVSGPVVIVTDTGSVITSVDAFTYRVPGAVTTVTPNSGQGGTTVLIEGVALLGGGTVLASVTLDGLLASAYSVSVTRIEVVAAYAPAESSIGDIVIISDSGSKVTAEDAWEYLIPGRVVSIQPNSGQIGTVVSIRGGNLFGGGSSVDTVTLAGIPVKEKVTATNTEVVVVVDDAEAAVGDIIITSDAGASVKVPGEWNQLERGSVTSLSPAQGQFGSRITVTGERMLGGGASVGSISLCGADLDVGEFVESQSDTEIVLRAPEAEAGSTGGLVIVSDSGSIVQNTDDLFTFIEPSRIISVFPTAGQAGSLITITGVNLLAGGTLEDALASLPQITVGGKSSVVVSVTNTVILIQLPGGDSRQRRGERVRRGGAGDIVIISATGEITVFKGEFVKLEDGVAQTISPTSGQIGTRIVVTGERMFGGGAKVEASTVAGFQATVVSATNEVAELIVGGSHGDATSGDVILIADTGALITGVTFNYVTQGTILSITPDNGQFNTRVVIEGSGLRGGGANIIGVSLAGTNVLSIDSESDSSVSVVAADAPAGVSREVFVYDGTQWDTVQTAGGDVILHADTGAFVTKEYGWTPNARGVITTVEPSYGQVGTRVVITGTALVGGGASPTRVSLAGVNAVVTAFDADSISIIAAQGTPDHGEILIEADTGAIVTLGSSWTYVPVSVVDSVAPDSGRLGTVVVVTGSGLLGGGAAHVSVTLAGVAATIQETSDTRMVIIAGVGPADAVSGQVLAVADTGAEIDLQTTFSYVAEGTITSIVPANGHFNTLVTISGSTLLGGGSHVTKVIFGDAEATIVSESDTEIVVTTAAHDGGLVGLHLISESGAEFISATNDIFEYAVPGGVDVISPTFGQRGTDVTITGSGMRGGGSNVATVTLAGIESEIKTESDESITVVATRSDAREGFVMLVADSGATITSTSTWRYDAEGSISTIQPTHGQYNTRVAIRGASLRGGGATVASVSLAGVAVKQIVDESNEVVNVIAAASDTLVGAAILVADSGAIVSADNVWSYATAGAIAGFLPTSGQFSTVVTISGTELLEGDEAISEVTLAGIQTTVISASNTKVVVAAGEGSTVAGRAQFVLQSGATITSDDDWTYITRGAIGSVTPEFGTVGTTVDIVGTNLLGGADTLASVSLAGIDAEIGAIAEGATHNDAIAIVATAPVNQARHSGDVLITASSGALTTLVNGWTYVEVAVINQLTPAQGQENTDVGIAGVFLFGGGTAITSVTLAGLEAELLAGQTQFRIPVRAARSQQSQTGDVRMVSDTGAVVVKDNAWTYIDEAVISSVSPQAGNVGTIVTIDGERLFMGGDFVTSVELAGVNAVIIQQSTTQIVVDAAPCESTVCASNGDVVINSNTGATVTFVNGWKYSQIETVTPTVGQLGTLITITGQSLRLDGTSVAGVKLAGIEVESIVSETDAEIVVVAGASTGSTGALAVSVTSNSGATMELAQAWTYLTPSEITEAVPNSGQIGTRVTMNGERMLGGGASIVSVEMGQNLATIESTSNDVFVVTIKDDASPSGSASDIIITADTGARTVLADGWTQLVRGEILSTSLDEGQIGTEFSISGARLRAGGANIVSVTLVGVAAEIVSENDDEVHVIVDHATPRQGNIVLTADTGARVVLINGFSFLEPGVISSVNPSEGQYGTLVSIIGTDMAGGGDHVFSVSLAGEDAPITSQSDTLVVVTSPIGEAKTGPVVLVAETGATVTLDNGWDFLEPGQVAVATPNEGTRGTRVVLSGAHLLGGGQVIESVTLVGIDAEIVSYTNDAIEIVVAPGGHPDTGEKGDVVITADTGATIIATNAFQYLKYGSDETASPAVGQTGTRVTVCGQDLLGGGEIFESALLGTCELEILSQEGDCITIEI